MLKLTEDEIEAGLNAIQHHGYSDFFPSPPEFDVVVNSWPQFKKYLADIDLDVPGLSAIARTFCAKVCN